MYKLFGKRLLDIAVSFVTLVVFSPVLFVLAVLIRAKLGSPVLFRQVRPGKHSLPFTMYKFRTMTNARPGRRASDAARLTAFGSFLRRASLDEFPELFNVLKGEMSLVGPRPLLMEYVPRYSAEQARRHSVMPGVTGWAQVNGLRGATQSPDKMERRIKHDVYYIENWSFVFDLTIIWRTVVTMLRGDKNAY